MNNFFDTLNQFYNESELNDFLKIIKKPPLNTVLRVNTLFTSIDSFKKKLNLLFKVG